MKLHCRKTTTAASPEMGCCFFCVAKYAVEVDDERGFDGLEGGAKWMTKEILMD